MPSIVFEGEQLAEERATGPRRSALALLALCAVAVSLRPIGGLAQEPGERARAEQEASAFLRGLDDDDLGDVYKLHAGPGFSSLPLERFVEQLGIARIQSGGPASSRVLVGGQPFSQSKTGQQGSFFYFRYRTAFPSGASVFQDVYLERIGSDWKIAGFWVQPIPPVSAR